MVLQIQNTHFTGDNMKKICIAKVGNVVEGLINVLTLGFGKDLAGWVATKLGYESCGCEERRVWLNEFFGCPDGIKL